MSVKPGQERLKTEDPKWEAALGYVWYFRPAWVKQNKPNWGILIKTHAIHAWLPRISVSYECMCCRSKRSYPASYSSSLSWTKHKLRELLNQTKQRKTFSASLKRKENGCQKTHLFFQTWPPMSSCIAFTLAPDSWGSNTSENCWCYVWSTSHPLPLLLTSWVRKCLSRICVMKKK